MATFYSGRWNTGTNPDLIFVSVGPDSRVPDKRILEKFPRSQHRPSLIVSQRFALPVPSKPVNQWNFLKTNWTHYNALTNKLAKSLLPPDSPDVDLAYQDFCNVIGTAAKNSIPRGRRNNHTPCWDDECENLYLTFLQSPEGSDLQSPEGSDLQSPEGRGCHCPAPQARQETQRSMVRGVQTIDFSHSSRKAWSILNNLTRRSRRSPRHCAVSAIAIAFQLIRNDRYEGIDRESSRLISQEVSDLWKSQQVSTSRSVNKIKKCQQVQ